MGQLGGTLIDVVHALLMAAWVLGLPLLFVHRWPRLTRAYAAFAIAFVVLNQVSEWILGECFLTTLARNAWQSSVNPPAIRVSNEWFTVRLAQAIFRMTPSHDAIKTLSEILVLLTAAGVVFREMRRRRKRVLAPAVASKSERAIPPA